MDALTTMLRCMWLEGTYQWWIGTRGFIKGSIAPYDNDQAMRERFSHKIR